MTPTPAPGVVEKVREAMQMVSDRAGHGIAGCSIDTALAVDYAIAMLRSALALLPAAAESASRAEAAMPSPNPAK